MACLLLVVAGLGFRWLSQPATDNHAGPADVPPTVTAEGVVLRAWQGTMVPVDSVHGPARFTDRRSAGFTRDANGAALAATHLSSRIDPHTDPDSFTPVISRQTVGNTTVLLAATRGSYRMLARSAKLTDGAPVPVTNPGQVRGWRILKAFDPDRVVRVGLLVTDPTGGSAEFVIPLTWTGGDWQLTPRITGGGVRFTVDTPRPVDQYTLFAQDTR